VHESSTPLLESHPQPLQRISFVPTALFPNSHGSASRFSLFPGAHQALARGRGTTGLLVIPFDTCGFFGANSVLGLKGLIIIDGMCGRAYTVDPGDEVFGRTMSNVGVERGYKSREAAPSKVYGQLPFVLVISIDFSSCYHAS